MLFFLYGVTTEPAFPRYLSIQAVGKAWDISSHSLMSERVSLPLHTHTHTHTHIHTHTHTHTMNFKELDEVMKQVLGGSRPYSIPNKPPTGCTLFLTPVGDLQEAEFDVGGSCDSHVIQSFVPPGF